MRPEAPADVVRRVDDMSTRPQLAPQLEEALDSVRVERSGTEQARLEGSVHCTRNATSSLRSVVSSGALRFTLQCS